MFGSVQLIKPHEVNNRTRRRTANWTSSVDRTTPKTGKKKDGHPPALEWVCIDLCANVGGERIKTEDGFTAPSPVGASSTVPSPRFSVPTPLLPAHVFRAAFPLVFSRGVICGKGRDFREQIFSCIIERTLSVMASI